MVEMEKLDKLSYKMISVIGNCVTTVVVGRTFLNCSERAKAEAISAEIGGPVPRTLA